MPIKHRRIAQPIYSYCNSCHTLCNEARLQNQANIERQLGIAAAQDPSPTSDDDCDQVHSHVSTPSNDDYDSDSISSFETFVSIIYEEAYQPSIICQFSSHILRSLQYRCNQYDVLVSDKKRRLFETFFRSNF